MANKGKSNHTKRISLPRSVPVTGRKDVLWIATTRPGPHAKSTSIPLIALLRDVLGICADLKEAKRILHAGLVLIDGKPVYDSARPVGIMDLVSVGDKTWRMQVSDSKLMPAECPADAAKFKYCKVVGKTTAKGKKIMVALHDGRTLASDNNAKVGSTFKMDLSSGKMSAQLPLAPGAPCYVAVGKHAGRLASLTELTQQEGKMDTRAKLKDKDGEFITLAKYVIVVDDKF